MRLQLSLSPWFPHLWRKRLKVFSHAGKHEVHNFLGIAQMTVPSMVGISSSNVVHVHDSGRQAVMQNEPRLSKYPDQSSKLRDNIQSNNISFEITSIVGLQRLHHLCLTWPYQIFELLPCAGWDLFQEIGCRASLSSAHLVGWRQGSRWIHHLPWQLILNKISIG